MILFRRRLRLLGIIALMCSTVFFVALSLSRDVTLDGESVAKAFRLIAGDLTVAWNSFSPENEVGPDVRDDTVSHQHFLHDCSSEARLSVLVGIFTTPGTRSRRNTLRRVYKAQQPVISKFLPRAHFEIRFVLGRIENEALRIAIEAEQAEFNDLIELDIGEDMNRGKTFAWFEHVDKTYGQEAVREALMRGPMAQKGSPESTHSSSRYTPELPYDMVLKVDDDTFVVFANAARDLVSLVGLPQVYWGKPANLPGFPSFFQKHLYMSGMCYGLSLDMVKDMSPQNAYSLVHSLHDLSQVQPDEQTTHRYALYEDADTAAYLVALNRTLNWQPRSMPFIHYDPQSELSAPNRHAHLHDEAIAVHELKEDEMIESVAGRYMRLFSPDWDWSHDRCDPQLALAQRWIDRMYHE